MLDGNTNFDYFEVLYLKKDFPLRNIETTSTDFIGFAGPLDKDKRALN